jgi:transcriptional regulator with XRE-family HTH domain
MSAEIIKLPEPSQYAVKVAAEVRAQAARKQIRGSRLAVILGISENAMSRRMTGKLPFGIDELAAVAAALDVTVQDLLPHLDSNQKPAGLLQEQQELYHPGTVTDMERWLADHGRSPLSGADYHGAQPRRAVSH